MKLFVILIGIVLAAVLRMNLPEKVGADSLKKEHGGLLGEIKGKIIYSDVVADWKYKDFLFVRFACSERLKVELIALPFKKWEMFDDKASKCAGWP